METQGYLCDIHTKKSGTVPLRKTVKKCGSVKCVKLKETRRFVVLGKHERAVCDSPTELSGTVPLENWKTPHMEWVWHSSRRKNHNQNAIIKNKYKWNSSANKTEPSKGKTEKQVYETCRSCLELQGVPIRKDSCWTIKWHLDLAQDVLRGFSPGVSKQFSKRVAGGNFESIEQNNQLMVNAKTLIKILYKVEFKANILRQLH